MADSPFQLLHGRYEHNCSIRCEYTAAKRDDLTCLGFGQRTQEERVLGIPRMKLLRAMLFGLPNRQSGPH